MPQVGRLVIYAWPLLCVEYGTIARHMGFTIPRDGVVLYAPIEGFGTARCKPYSNHKGWYTDYVNALAARLAGGVHFSGYLVHGR